MPACYDPSILLYMVAQYVYRYIYIYPAKCIVNQTKDGQKRLQDGHSIKLTNTYRDKQTGWPTDRFRLRNRDAIRQTHSNTDAARHTIHTTHTVLLRFI